MNIILEKIKNDTLSGILELAGKTWLPVVIATIAYVILSNLVITPIMLSSMGLSQERIMALQQMSADPMGMQQEMEAIFEMVKKLGIFCGI